MADGFDVIVVGSGSGGGVVASRLTEDPNLRVLLLEAGPDPGEAVPDDIRHVRLGSGVAGYDWEYNDPSIGSALPRGRVLGGSSAVNASVALRGQPQDYDAWAAMGADGWGWDDCLPYFNRLEDDAQFGDAPYHGRGGPIHVTRQLPLWEAEALFVAACQERGHEAVDDLNRPGAIGVGPLPRNIRDGVRQSVLLTYLAAARARPNLTTRADAMVDRLLLEGGAATGVLLAGGEEVRGGRVVLAAGAYNTPPILLRSGVGAPEDLAAAGVECRHPLPGVGRNLMDHPVTLMAVDMDYPADPDLMRMAALVKFRSAPDEEVDDLKISFYPGEIFNMGGLTGVYLEVNRVRSRGTVGIRDIDPASAPAIDHRYLSDARDVDLMVAGMKEGVAIVDVMSRSTRCELLLPDAATAADDEQLREHAAQFHGTGYHPSGTCRMGADDDELAVVDARLRVRGIDRLHVVDASVMPDLPRCNINLPTMMIGERGADLVRDEL
ncbi:MAG: choline dehydrogenase [Chloroflexota bacterium]|nr:choline dehydrogenase [Chloroflexota bacterium]